MKVLIEITPDLDNISIPWWEPAMYNNHQTFSVI